MNHGKKCHLIFEILLIIYMACLGSGFLDYKKLTSGSHELSSNISELSTISYFKFSKLGRSWSELLAVSEVFIFNQMHQENVKRYFYYFLQKLTSHISLISNYYASIIQILLLAQCSNTFSHNCL